MFTNVSFSPNGDYLMLTTIEKLFSYLIPYSRFPMKSTVYDSKGNFVKVVNELELNEIIPQGFMAVRQGKRTMYWRADKQENLVYVEALGEGDPAKKDDLHDADDN